MWVAIWEKLPRVGGARRRAAARGARARVAQRINGHARAHIHMRARSLASRPLGSVCGRGLFETTNVEIQHPLVTDFRYQLVLRVTSRLQARAAPHSHRRSPRASGQEPTALGHRWWAQAQPEPPRSRQPQWQQWQQWALGRRPRPLPARCWWRPALCQPAVDSDRLLGLG